MRIGIGHDIHKLVPGRPLVIGGVTIPSPVGEEAHSDGDVLIHALIDSILGAINAGDIGEHFPDTDEEYRNADSLNLLKNVMEEYGPRIINIDSTVFLDSPKLSTHVALMRKIISETLSIREEDISIKCKTTESLMPRYVASSVVVLID